jgi:hypothetical protein
VNINLFACEYSEKSSSPKNEQLKGVGLNMQEENKISLENEIRQERNSLKTDLKSIQKIFQR